MRVQIEHGADVNATDENHRTPLHLASSSGSVENKRGIDRAWHECKRERWERQDIIASGIVLTVSRNCAGIGEARCGSHLTDQWHRMHLHLALSSQRPKIVRLLIKQGMDVNTRDGDRKMPLDLALSSMSVEIMQVFKLIKHGANVNAKDGDYRTPLHQATSGNRTTIDRTRRRSLLTGSMAPNAFAFGVVLGEC